MPIALYMDQHVPRSITTGLRARQVDILTAAEDGASAFTDPELLERAALCGRVLFSQDDDLLAEAAAIKPRVFPSGAWCTLINSTSQLGGVSATSRLLRWPESPTICAIVCSSYHSKRIFLLDMGSHNTSAESQ